MLQVSTEVAMAFFSLPRSPRVAAALIVLVVGAGLSIGCGNGVNVPGVGILGGKWRYHCASPKQPGQYCEVQEECAAGSFCDTTKKLCSTAWAAYGAGCNASWNNCPKGFCKGLPMTGTCYAASCDAAGVCTAGASLKTPCDPNAPQPSCGPNAMCIGAMSQQAVCTPLAKAGQACEGFGQCEGALICHPQLGTCVEPTAIGGKCRIRETCAAGLYCLDANNQVADASDMTEKGTCKAHPQLPVGAPCIGDVCAKGLHCDYSVNTCAKDYAIGASCSQGNECGEFKGLQADCVQGSCVATHETGAKCYPGPEQRCPAGLVCASEP
jgi:hypothetical protein